jgi:hypothetical protein
MFPNTIEFLGRERDKERLADAEHIRLVKIARGQQFNYGEASRKTINWLGSQMVKWGAKLQSQGSAPSPQISSMETIS